MFISLCVCSFGYTPNSRHTFVILCVNMCPSLFVSLLFVRACSVMLVTSDIDEFILWCQDGSVVFVFCSFGYHMFDCILAIQTFLFFLAWLWSYGWSYCLSVFALIRYTYMSYHRIILGKVPTQDGSKNAYTFISGR